MTLVFIEKGLVLEGCSAPKIEDIHRFQVIITKNDNTLWIQVPPKKVL